MFPLILFSIEKNKPLSMHALLGLCFFSPCRNGKYTIEHFSKEFVALQRHPFGK